jgi:putative transposase
MEVFDSLPEAQFVIENWREDYNTERPHSALKYLSPARFIQQWENCQEALRQIA